MMIMGDYDGQLIFGDLGGLKLPDICPTDEEKPRKNLIQETCPDRGSNPGSLRDRRACYRLSHSGGESPFCQKTFITLVLKICRLYLCRITSFFSRFHIFTDFLSSDPLHWENNNLLLSQELWDCCK